MVESGKVTIDVNSSDSRAGEITLTTETTLSLFVMTNGGSHNNHRLGIEVSPASVGDIWVKYRESLLGKGCMTMNCVAKRARIAVIEAEGASNTVEAYLIAR